MKTKKRIKQRQDSNLFQLLMFRFFPYWPLFLGLGTISLIAAWLYLQLATPVYEIKATLLIKDEKKGVENSQVVESMNILESKKIVENEIEVIKSRTLMRETIKKLQLCTPVFEEGMITEIPAYTTSPVMVEIADFDNFQEAERVDFTFYPNSSTVLFEGKEYQLNEWIKSGYAELRFVMNPIRQRGDRLASLQS